MSILLATMLAATPALPFIDRAALHTLARFEALRDAHADVTPGTRPIAVLCDSASRSASPLDSGSELGRVYSMTHRQVSILKSTCALHRASRTRGQSASR